MCLLKPVPAVLLVQIWGGERVGRFEKGEIRSWKRGDKIWHVLLLSKLPSPPSPPSFDPESNLSIRFSVSWHSILSHACIIRFNLTSNFLGHYTTAKAVLVETKYCTMLGCRGNVWALFCACWAVARHSIASSKSFLFIPFNNLCLKLLCIYTCKCKHEKVLTATFGRGYDWTFSWTLLYCLSKMLEMRAFLWWWHQPQFMQHGNVSE